MNVKDTILYVQQPKFSIRIVPAHGSTKRPWRLTDGIRHPVKIIKPGVKHETTKRN